MTDEPNACGHETGALDLAGRWAVPATRELPARVYCSAKCAAEALVADVQALDGRIAEHVATAVAADRAAIASTLELRSGVERRKAERHTIAADLLHVLGFDVEAGRLS